MRQFEFISGLKKRLIPRSGCVATIGSFDGVHLGHQSILRRLIDVGQKMSLPTAVVIFEPQPHEYFTRERAPARLMRLREKVTALRQFGANYVVCLRFDSVLRNLSAEQFVDRVLNKQLSIKHLEIGDDFRFGCDRQGDFAMLKSQGEKQGFTVCDTKTLEVAGARVSSTRIRSLLDADSLTEAAELLGRPFSVSGRVIYGRQIGRTIGVPTANIGLGRFRSPVHGVYAVKVKRHGEDHDYLGVANVGVKPTVTGSRKPLLEVHLFEFDQILYGQCLEVIFCHKLRDEQKFTSLDQLKNQIQTDIKAGRDFFGLAPLGC